MLKAILKLSLLRRPLILLFLLVFVVANLVMVWIAVWNRPEIVR